MVHNWELFRDVCRSHPAAMLWLTELCGATPQQLRVMKNAAGRDTGWLAVLSSVSGGLQVKAYVKPQPALLRKARARGRCHELRMSPTPAVVDAAPSWEACVTECLQRVSPQWTDKGYEAARVLAAIMVWLEQPLRAPNNNLLGITSVNGSDAWTIGPQRSRPPVRTDRPARVVHPLRVYNRPEDSLLDAVLMLNSLRPYADGRRAVMQSNSEVALWDALIAWRARWSGSGLERARARMAPARAFRAVQLELAAILERE